MDPRSLGAARKGGQEREALSARVLRHDSNVLLQAIVVPHGEPFEAADWHLGAFAPSIADRLAQPVRSVL